MQKMKRESDGMYIKKGPWTAEEDEVVINHVKTNGARDWSSIISKGLLPRTGKSCRLRWVNKLRPNLKTGCKFSVEEERVVLQLQAQVGNKWAKIATYLPGRTDNDVKNFWSSRQKRLRRLTHSTSPLKTRKNKEIKSLVHQVPKVSTLDYSPSYQSNHPNVDSEEFRMVMPVLDMMKSNLLNMETGLSMVDASNLGSEIINDQDGLIRESKSKSFFGDLSQDMLDYFEPVSNTS